MHIIKSYSLKITCSSFFRILNLCEVLLPTIYLERVALNNNYNKITLAEPQLSDRLAISAWDGFVAIKRLENINFFIKWSTHYMITK